MISVQVQCPYCGHIHSPKWFSIDDEYNELICANCDEIFIAEADLIINTKKLNND